MTAPRRFALHEPYSAGELARRGVTVVKTASPYGSASYFETFIPCCLRRVRIDAAMHAGSGALVTCRGCGWKWDVYLACGDERLAQLPREARHPHIKADRAEWVSRGFGTRPYRRRK